MSNAYKHSKQFPYHISVGAVLVNGDGLIACQHYSKETIVKFTGIERDIYTLMRETIEGDETIIDAVHRGLREECDVKGEIVGYLGSLETPVFNTKESGKIDFTKTTLYFLVKILPEQTLVTTNSDDGVAFENEWMEPSKLIEIMDKQSEGLIRKDFNESEIIRRAQGVM